MRFIPQLGLLLAVGLLCAGTLAAQNAPKLVQVGVVKDYAYTVKPIDNNGLNLILVNEHVVKFKHASYVSLDLASVTLGEGSFLEFTSILDSDMQIMPHDNIQDMTAFFNGDAVRVRLWAAPNTRGNGYRITKVSVGNPPALQPNTICGTGDDRVRSGDWSDVLPARNRHLRLHCVLDQQDELLRDRGSLSRQECDQDRGSVPGTVIDFDWCDT